jgi:DHA3 family macrolide efflux protein-like MFS transporter
MKYSTDINIKDKWLRSFGPIWIGQAFSLLGSNLVQFALVWWLTEKTGSTAVLATATLVALLPEVILSPFAGALVDRWNRKRVMIIADTGIAVTTLGLVFLFLSGSIQPWHIYIAMFLRALGGGFHFPAMTASSSLMVPEKHLSRLAGANQALAGLMKIAAPPLGALLLSLMPMQNVLVIDIVTAGLAVVPLFFILIPQPVREEASVTVRSVLKDVSVGFRYVASWPGLMAILFMAAAINFLINPAFTFLPLLVTRHFHGGAVEYGWLESGFGIGVILGGVLLSVWGGFRRKVLTSMTSLIGMGIGILAVGLVSESGYWIALTAIILTGFMNPLVNGPFFALIQSKVDPEMQGRVITMVVSLAGAMSPISMIIAAPVAERLGLQSWYVLGGVICILMAAGGLFSKTVMTVESQTQGSKIHPAKQTVAVPSD